MSHYTQCPQYQSPSHYSVPVKKHAREAVCKGVTRERELPLRDPGYDKDGVDSMYMPMDRQWNFRRSTSLDEHRLTNHTKKHGSSLEKGDGDQPVYMEMKAQHEYFERNENEGNGVLTRFAESDSETPKPIPPPPPKTPPTPALEDEGDYSFLPPPVPFNPQGDVHDVVTNNSNGGEVIDTTSEEGVRVQKNTSISKICGLKEAAMGSTVAICTGTVASRVNMFDVKKRHISDENIRLLDTGSPRQPQQANTYFLPSNYQHAPVPHTGAHHLHDYRVLNTSRPLKDNLVLVAEHEQQRRERHPTALPFSQSYLTLPRGLSDVSKEHTDRRPTNSASKLEVAPAVRELLQSHIRDRLNRPQPFPPASTGPVATVHRTQQLRTLYSSVADGSENLGYTDAESSASERCEVTPNKTAVEFGTARLDHSNRGLRCVTVKKSSDDLFKRELPQETTAGSRCETIAGEDKRGEEAVKASCGGGAYRRSSPLEANASEISRTQDLLARPTSGDKKCVTLLSVNQDECHTQRRRPFTACKVHDRVAAHETVSDLTKEDQMLEVMSQKITVLMDSIDRQNRRIDSMRRAIDRQQQQSRPTSKKETAPVDHRESTYCSLDILSDGVQYKAAEHHDTSGGGSDGKLKKRKKGTRVTTDDAGIPPGSQSPVKNKWTWKNMSCVH